jgi:hypothetical protein
MIQLTVDSLILIPHLQMVLLIVYTCNIVKYIFGLNLEDLCHYPVILDSYDYFPDMFGYI